MSNHIETIIRNTQRHHFEDGLNEVFIGALAFLGGIVILISKFPFVAFVLFALGVILITKSLERIKERYTYQRSGYVTYKEHKSKLWVTLLLALICCLVAIAALLLAIWLDYEHAIAWSALIVSIFVGIALLINGIKLRLCRISLLGAFTIIVGFLLSPAFFGPSITQGYNGLSTFGLFFFLMGTAFFISGRLRFRQYLLENPLPVEYNNE